MPDSPFVVSLTTAHAVSTWALVGLIWVVQLAIYPLFRQVGVERFRSYHAAYCARIAWVVAPCMLVELLAAVGLLWLGEGPFRRSELVLGLVAIAGIWLATALFSVPAHRQLARGFDAAAQRRLVRTNWIRTVLWTGRGVWIAWVMDRVQS